MLRATPFYGTRSVLESEHSLFVFLSRFLTTCFESGGSASVERTSSPSPSERAPFCILPFPTVLQQNRTNGFIGCSETYLKRLDQTPEFVGTAIHEKRCEKTIVKISQFARSSTSAYNALRPSFLSRWTSVWAETSPGCSSRTPLRV